MNLPTPYNVSHDELSKGLKCTSKFIWESVGGKAWWTAGWTLDIPKYIFFLDEDTTQFKHMSVHNNPMFFPLRDFLRFIPCERAAQRLTTPSSCSLQHTQTNASEPVFLNVYGA